MEPKVIFEDEYLAVVDKPAGMVTNDSKTSGENTVQKWFKAKLKVESGKLKVDEEFWEKGGVVHRLDKDTSGLLVLAKTPEAYENLKQQFLERQTKKTYIALVFGKMDPENGVISLPIERHPKVWGKFAIGSDPSLTAITEWKVLGSYSLLTAHYSLLELKPMTGRTHQIRVHMQHLGHPIVADPIYSGKRRLKDDRAWCPRLFLHARQLEFLHPVTRQVMNVKAEIPADLEQALKKLVH